MKKNKPFFIALLLSLPIVSSSQDSIALNIVKSNLDTIEAFMKNQAPKPIRNVLIAAKFLSDLTGIPSSSGGGYAGPNTPNDQDVYNWKIWFELNKNYLYWNEKLRIIILQKRIPIPIIKGLLI